MPSSLWIAFKERMPPEQSGFLLVTNNILATNSWSFASQWLVFRVHVLPDGEICAYAEPFDLRLRNLTHWRFALPEKEWPDA